MEIGRLCVKLAGRDAGKKCVVVDVLKDNFVLIDGATRRRKCNILHLEPLAQSIQIKKGASHAEVAKEFKKLGIEAFESKPKKASKKEVKAEPMAEKVKEAKKEVKEKPAKKKKETKK